MAAEYLGDLALDLIQGHLEPSLHSLQMIMILSSWVMRAAADDEGCLGAEV